MRSSFRVLLVFDLGSYFTYVPTSGELPLPLWPGEYKRIQVFDAVCNARTIESR